MSNGGFNAKIDDAENIINNLSSIFGDEDDSELASAKDELESIRTDTENSVSEFEKNSDMDVSLSLSANVSDLYDSGINKIDKLIFSLKEKYGSNYLINKNLEYLKGLLNRADFKENDISEKMEILCNECIVLLDNVYFSRTPINDKILNDVYDFMYNMMKIELVFSSKDTILKKVRSREEHAFPIAKRLKAELDSIDDDDIKLFSLDLEKQSINFSVILEKNLITKVALHNNSDYQIIKRVQFLQLVDDLESNKSDIDKFIVALKKVLTLLK